MTELKTVPTAEGRADTLESGLQYACDLVCRMVGDYPEHEEVLHTAVGRLWVARSVALGVLPPESIL